MNSVRRIFAPRQPLQRRVTWGDGIVLVVIAVLISGGVRLALDAPQVIAGPAISLSLRNLPLYAALSIARMAAAYVLSMLFTLVYGYGAAYTRWGERVLLPLLDVLQSVPILSFLPVVLLSFTAILPQGVAAELAAVVLIFTSQAWNLTFAWYQALTTIPGELREASTIFHFNGWLRLTVLQMPFAAMGLLWNSMMSWSGGWFFLMAAEMFTVGQRNFRLPGLGAYLHAAADQGDMHAVAWGVGTLVLVVVALDQFGWRPLLAWAERFKFETLAEAQPASSWFYEALRHSRLVAWFVRAVAQPVKERLDAWFLRHFPMTEEAGSASTRRPWVLSLLAAAAGGGLLYGVYQAGQLLVTVPLSQWGSIGIGVGATLLRVLAALAITLVWTVPVGVAIGTNRRLAAWLQPLVQIAAAVPATALFPVFLLLLLHLPGGLNLAAVVLMLTGTQWYLLFNVIAGASAIPQDLKYTATLLQMRWWARWRTLILPALFPYIISGADRKSVV